MVWFCPRAIILKPYSKNQLSISGARRQGCIIDDCPLSKLAFFDCEMQPGTGRPRTVTWTWSMIYLVRPPSTLRDRHHPHLVMIINSATMTLVDINNSQSAHFSILPSTSCSMKTRRHAKLSNLLAVFTRASFYDIIVLRDLEYLIQDIYFCYMRIQLGSLWNLWVLQIITSFNQTG